MKILLSLHIFVLIRFCSNKESLPATTYLLVTRVGPCRERKPSELITVSEMSLNKEKYDSTLSGEFSIITDIKNGWRVKATMQKCHDIRNLDTCDFYKSLSIVRNGCLDSDEADVYSMFFEYIAPKMDCPVTAGNYSIVDFPFFTENSDLKASESKISTSIFGYTYRLEGYDEDDEKLFCVESHILLNYLREHNWIAGQKFDVRTSPQDNEDERTKEESSKEDDKEENGDEDEETGQEDENKKNTENDYDDDYK